MAACHHAPAGQAVRSALAAAVGAARANDVKGVLAVVSDDFTGNDGELDRRGLRQVLAMRALRQDRTGVLLGPVSLQREGDRVVAKFNLVLTGGASGDLLPEHAAIYAMTTAWRNEHGTWRCYHATWSDAGH
ncbi:MAG TPA: hypothetical protein VF292_08060 [Rhodanobacteraceae bacterium]